MNRSKIIILLSSCFLCFFIYIVFTRNIDKYLKTETLNIKPNNIQFNDKPINVYENISESKVINFEVKNFNESSISICKKCNFANSSNDRYCLNCTEPQWVLSDKETLEIRRKNKILSDERNVKTSILVEKERQYNARRKLFGHYHTIYAKIKDSSQLSKVTKKDVKLLTDGIEALYNFKIYYQFNHKLFFSSKNHFSATGKQVNFNDMLNVLITLEGFFNSYPKKLIQTNLKAIYFVEDLTLKGKSPAGFAWNSSFWISCRSKERSFSKSEYIRIIHHEFAHILHQNNSFPTKRWLNINEKDFKYIGSGWDLIGGIDTNYGGVARNEKGFLIKYNEASLEEDIAVYAEWLFTNEDELLKKVQQYDRVRQKYNMILNYYKKLGVSFT